MVDKLNGVPAFAEGLLYRLIVRLHRYSLGRDDYRNSCHWQRGLLIDDGYNGRALLEQIGTDIRMTVRAAFPERLLHYICEEVKWLVRRDAPDLQRAEVIDASGAELRQLQSWLKEKDPGFGGLIPVRNRRHQFLWVHQRFASEY